VNRSAVPPPVTAVMDAYSGETWLYVMDEQDPIIATWREVYPELFTDRSEMPAGNVADRTGARYARSGAHASGTATQVQS